MKPVRIGCSGWNYDSWRGPVYPEGLPKRRWLERYAELFDTVEVNNSFYRLPERRTVGEWCERTPDDFLFAFKVSRYLTHVKRLKAAGDGMRRFRARLRPAVESGKLGPLLWQLPPNFQCDLDRLARVLDVTRPDESHAFEFRHESWFRPETYELLRDAGAALVVGVHPDRPYSAHEMTAPWTYVRFHWGERGRRGNYSSAELDTWRRRVAAWRSKREVWAYFNNDWEAFAPRNALELRGDRSG